MRKAVSITDIETDLGRILPEAKQMADGWQSEDLEHATDLHL